MFGCGFGMLAGVDGILKFRGMYRVCIGYVWGMYGVCIGTYVCFFSEQCSQIANQFYHTIPYDRVRSKSYSMYIGHNILYQHVESTDVKYTSELKYFLRTFRYTAIIIDLSR